MNPSHGNLRAAIVLGALVLAIGCSTSSPPVQPSSGPSEASAPRCRGTLGIEVVPISRALRKKLGLPDGIRGAVVSEVLAGGPAAAAGVRPNDVVEVIGTAHVGNDCDFIDAAYNRTCEPVRVVLWRSGAIVEIRIEPADQDALLEKSCQEGGASGCYRRAWDLWNRGDGSQRDQALALYDKACVAGSAEACAEEGLHLTDRPNRSRDAIAAVKRACDLGSGAGCAHLAFLYATGTLVARDDRRATPLYVRSCERGDAQGCYNAGLMADDGRGVARDVSRALVRYEEACEMGSSAACTNLGFHYEKGRGVSKNGSRAFALYERGCAGTSCQPSNLTGCINVGRSFRDGIGVAPDASRSATIFREVCDRKPLKNDPDSAESSARACSLLGDLYLDGKGVELDLSKGRELLERGCERGDSFGCFNAGASYTGGAGADPAKAASLFQQACQGGDADGCHNLAQAYEKGRGVPRDARRAAELSKRACELGLEAACGKK